MKIGYARSDQAAAEPQWRGYPDRPPRLAGQGGHGRFRLGDGVKHLLGARIEDCAMFGRRELARGAVEKAHAEVLFKFLNSVGRDRKSTRLNSSHVKI